MTVAATFDLDPVTVALRGWLQDRLRATFTAFAASAVVGDSQAPLDAAGRPVPPPYAVLYALPGVRSAPAWAGATYLTGRWQGTFVGATPSQARTWADAGRRHLAGEDLDGRYVSALSLPGVVVVRRASLDDGAIDLAGLLWSWSETFELDLTPA